MTGFAIYETPQGWFRLGYADGVLTHLKRIETVAEDRGTKTPLTERAYGELLEYFAGKRKTFSIPYRAEGTDFQKRVWQALCEIPYGETRSYKDIAAAIGNPKASRAVGMANNKNPIALVVPCHRVIGANGTLVGYAGGLPLKAFLLDMEEKNK